jgi:hypothetical protein
MKHYLSFNDASEDDRAKLKDILRATDMSLALWDISQEVFRPARKHGYPDVALAELIDKNPSAVDIIGLLEVKFHEILENHNVTID